MNTAEIRVKGCITDSITNLPIPNAKVTVLCWYHAGWDKTDYISIDTIADKNGCFNAFFNKGYKVVVASISPNHFPILKETNGVEKKNIEIDLRLKQSNGSSNINLRHYIVQNSSN